MDAKNSMFSNSFRSILDQANSVNYRQLAKKPKKFCEFENYKVTLLPQGHCDTYFIKVNVINTKTPKNLFKRFTKAISDFFIRLMDKDCSCFIPRARQLEKLIENKANNQDRSYRLPSNPKSPGGSSGHMKPPRTSNTAHSNVPKKNQVAQAPDRPNIQYDGWVSDPDYDSDSSLSSDIITPKKHVPEDGYHSDNEVSGTSKVGFRNLGNSCFANASLKALIGIISPEFIQNLKNNRLHDNDPRQPVRDAFIKVYEATNNNRQHPIKKPLQRLFTACFDYKDHNTNPFKNILNKSGRSFEQNDAEEFISPLMGILGIGNNPEFCFLRTPRTHISLNQDLHFSKSTNNNPSQSNEAVLSLPLTSKDATSLQEHIKKKLIDIDSVDEYKFNSEDWPNHSLKFHKGTAKALDQLRESFDGKQIKCDKAWDNSFSGPQVGSGEELITDFDSLHFLTIHFKIFDIHCTRGTFKPDKLIPNSEKLKASLGQIIKIPMTDRNGNQQELSFRLKSACVHSGATSTSGHYMAVVNHAEGKTQDDWKLHDDSSVTSKKSLSDAMKHAAPYILFFERV